MDNFRTSIEWSIFFSQKIGQEVTVRTFDSATTMPSKNTKIFGNAGNPGGAIVVITSFEDAKVALELWATEYFKHKGMKITKNVEDAIKSFAANEVSKIEKDLKVIGVPSYLKKIFEFKKKREVRGYLRSIKITQNDFVALINNSEQIGYSHRLIKREFVPENLELNADDLGAIKASKMGPLSHKTQKAVSKIGEIFQQRKVNHCHLYERGDEWHAFLFTYEDIRGDRRPHFKHGTHVHYVSSLWGTISKEDLLRSMEKRHKGDGGALHVKIEPWE